MLALYEIILFMHIRSAQDCYEHDMETVHINKWISKRCIYTKAKMMTVQWEEKSADAFKDFGVWETGFVWCT